MSWSKSATAPPKTSLFYSFVLQPPPPRWDFPTGATGRAGAGGAGAGAGGAGAGACRAGAGGAGAGAGRSGARVSGSAGKAS